MRSLLAQRVVGDHEVILHKRELKQPGRTGDAQTPTSTVTLVRLQAASLFEQNRNLLFSATHPEMSELQQIMSIQENLRTFEDISLISSTPSISLAFNRDFFPYF